MKEYNLRPLWDELLKVYKVFAAICDKHHLRYYACGGTALGAVRHKGFIPWDDDVDMFMPRCDYARFVEIVQAELPEGFSWQSIENDPDYKLPFGKVWNNDKIMVNEVRRESNLLLEQGVYIDILPLDGIPKDRFRLFLWLAWRSIWRHLPRFLTDNQGARLRHQRFRSAIDFDSAERVEDSKESAERLKRTAWTAKTFGEPVWMEFDSVKVPLPHDWDEYLRGMIGSDYMTPPPPEKRVPGHR
ncbi:MAG: LicD family protein [Kiritimatiellae bacterium]|nr:LicD family protein [Bacteroidales bacterium]MBR3222440.1 LicD family protein [Kiritimatiellia bacterium]